MLCQLDYTGLPTQKFGFCKTLIATKTNMSSTCSTCSSPNLITEMDRPECLVRGTGSPNESSDHVARASREILAHEAKILYAWMQALEDSGVEDVDNVDEYIKIENEGL